MFLGVRHTLVEDEPAIAAVEAVAAVAKIPEVIEDLTADPLVQGSPAVPGIPGIAVVAAVAAVTHLDVGRVYIEDSPSVIVKALEEGDAIAFYHIGFTGLVPTLFKCAVGSRGPAEVKELIELTAGGNVVGRATM